MQKQHLIALSVLVTMTILSACDSASLPGTAPTAIPTRYTGTPTTLATPLEPTATTQIAVPTVTAQSELVGPGCGSDRMANSPRDGLGDELFPDLGNAGFDVQHYDLNLVVDVEANTLNATTTIDALALKDLSSFNLDFHGLSITNLAVDDVGANYERDEHELTITPRNAVKSGQAFEVRVSYEGTPGTVERNGSPTEGWTNYKDGIYVAGEPDGASTFYPVNEHPCDKATYTLTVTVPQPYVVAATGKLKDTTSQDGKTTYEWESIDPVASYLVGLNIARFDLITDKTPDGVPIRSYYPKDLSPEAKRAFEQTPEMVQFLSDTFGPYPFDEYGVVVADTTLGFALETQTLSLFGSNVSRGSNPPDETALHELAHQWFGDSVSLKQWRDIWLNEGFATYAQWLWLEHTQGRKALDERVRLMYSAVNDEHGIAPGDPGASSLFNVGVYLRGGLTLHALRLQVGDDNFFKILKTYAARFRHSNADTNDFIAVAQEISGQDLKTLFDGWLYAPTMPDMPQLGLFGPQGAPTPTITPEAQSTSQAATLTEGWNKIVPGGDTACARGTPYAFWARPGKSDKLLIYFQGGGGCWNYETCRPGSTFFNDRIGDDSSPAYYSGVFDFSNHNNPFADYNVVFVSYCTGDVHMGSYTQTYTAATGGDEVTIQHKGFINSAAAVQWAHSQFPAPTSVFVAGCSAGSIGSIVFAPYVIRQYSGTPVTQLGDSEAYVVDHPVDLQTDWHAHDNFPNWIRGIADIKPGNFTMSRFYSAIADYYPQNTFAQYNTAHDFIQQRFYFAAALTSPTPPPWETGLKASLNEIHAAAPNFRSYTAQGADHCVTPTDKFYTEDTGGTSFRNWVNSLAQGDKVEDWGR